MHDCPDACGEYKNMPESCHRQPPYLKVAFHWPSSKPVTATKSSGPMCSAGGLPLRVTNRVGPLVLMSAASCRQQARHQQECEHIIGWDRHNAVCCATLLVLTQQHHAGGSKESTEMAEGQRSQMLNHARPIPWYDLYHERR